jgi:hypothetical protein
MNKILEILEKKQKENKRTGSLWDWNEGYPESQWEILCRLENGHFFEDKNKLLFYTTENETFGFKDDKKGYISEKTKEKIFYWSTGEKITKNLVEKGVFEITDRVGHYIKLRVDPMLNEVSTVKNDYKSIRLNGQELALLFMALSKGLFDRPKKGQVYYESYQDGSCTLYFKRDYYSSLAGSVEIAYYQGKFRQSNSEADWNYLKDKIDSAEISQKDNIEDLELYSIYDE